MSLIFKKSTAQPQFTVAAAITGTAEVGETLTCTYTVTKARADNVIVRWYSYDRTDGIEPTGETLLGTGTTYVLMGNEVGKYVRAIVTATNPAGAVLSYSSYSAAITTGDPPDPPSIAAVAVIGGDVEVGATLTVTYDFNDETGVAIQWIAYASQVASTGENLGTSSTQVLTNLQDGQWIGCEVTATNSVGSIKSTAARVGPVAPLSTVAPSVVSAAAIALDDGADGYNEGEYIICDATFSGHTSSPTFTWYKCDNLAKDNAEVITLLDDENNPYNAGDEAIQPLPVSEPNHYRGALFLSQSLQLYNTGKYVFCRATATNGADPGTTDSDSDAVGPIGPIQGTAINQTMVGSGPYYLPTANTTYYLSEDISTGGTAFIANKNGQKLNLNGKTVTFDNATPVSPTNGGFEDGETGWDWTNSGNPGAGAGEAGIETYAAIHTAVDFEDSYNRKKINDGMRGLTWKVAACSDNGVERYITSTLPDSFIVGKDYSLSFMPYRNQVSQRFLYGTCTNGVVTLTSGVFPSWAGGYNVYIDRSDTLYRVASRDSDTQATLTNTGASLSYGEFVIRVVTPVFVRVRHSTDGVVATASLNTPQYRGMAFTETFFTAKHTSGYTVEVGIVGTSGTTNETYIDDVKVSRTRSVGFFVTETGDVSGWGAKSVAITNAGSGYVDGTYSAVASTYIAGGAPATNPTFNITVSGGAVTSATVAFGGYYVFYGNTFTVNNSLLGGGGSGLVLTVNARQVTYPGGAPLQLRPPDETTRYNSGNETCTVKNGTFVQGQNRGSWPACVLVDDHGHRVHRITGTVYGEDGSQVRSARSWGIITTVKDCTWYCDWLVSSLRDHGNGSAHMYIHGTAARNKFYNYPISGILATAGGTGALYAYGNYFFAKSRWTNGRAVLADRGGSLVYDNIVNNTGEYSGRGMLGTCTVGTSPVKVYNNIISIQPARLNQEYGGFSAFGDHALQVEGLESGYAVEVYNNTITAIGSAETATASNEKCVANAISINTIKAGSSVKVYGNNIVAEASNIGYANCLLFGDDASYARIYSGIDFYQNSWTTNSILLGGSWDTLSDFRDGVVSVLPAVTNTKRLLIGDARTSTPPPVDIAWDFVDCTFVGGTLAEIAAADVMDWVRYDPNPVSAARGGYWVKWTITFYVGEPAAAVVVKYGTTTLVTGTANDAGVCNLYVPQYLIAGSTTTDYNSGVGLTVEATKDALSGTTSFTADAAKTVIVSMS